MDSHLIERRHLLQFHLKHVKLSLCPIDFNSHVFDGSTMPDTPLTTVRTYLMCSLTSFRVPSALSALSPGSSGQRLCFEDFRQVRKTRVPSLSNSKQKCRLCREKGDS